MKCYLRFFVVVVVSCILLGKPYLAQSAENACGLAPRDDLKSSIVYKKRGNYCEGVYEKGYSNEYAIRLLGYHLHPIDYALEFDDTATIEVDAPESEDVNVVFLDTVAAKFYRRDQQLKGGETVVWPLDIVADQDVLINANQLVGIACKPNCNNDIDAYYAVSVYSQARPEINPSVFLELPINTNKVRLSAVDAKTKQTVEDANGEPYAEVRSFLTTSTKLIEMFVIPKFNDKVYLQIEIKTLDANGHSKNLITSFPLGKTHG